MISCVAGKWSDMLLLFWVCGMVPTTCAAAPRGVTAALEPSAQQSGVGATTKPKVCDRSSLWVPAL